MSLKFEYTTVARCGPEHIWQVFSEIERWPRWDPEAIQSVRWVSGAPWEKGSRFEIRVTKPMSYTITPELLDVQPPIYIHWSGKGGGVTGEQFFIFKPLSDETTEMVTLQEFSGAPVTLFAGKIRAPIQAGIEHMFSRIRMEAESLAAGPVEIPTPSPAETVAEMLATSLAESLAVESPSAEIAEPQKTESSENQTLDPDSKPEEPK